MPHDNTIAKEAINDESQMKNKCGFTPRLPRSIKAAAETLSVLSTADFFMQRAKRAKPDAIDRILNRSGGEPPRAGDELPEKF